MKNILYEDGIAQGLCPIFPRATNLPRQRCGAFLFALAALSQRCRCWHGDVEPRPYSFIAGMLVEEIFEQLDDLCWHGVRKLVEELGRAVPGINCHKRQDEKKQPRPERLFAGLSVFDIGIRCHWAALCVEALSVALPRLSTWGVSDFLLEAENIAALGAAYHVFGRIDRRTLGAKASRHLVDAKIDIGVPLLVLLGCLGKAAMSAFGAFEFAGISIARSHGPSFVWRQVAIDTRQFNTYRQPILRFAPRNDTACLPNGRTACVDFGQSRHFIGFRYHS
ncbi:hypothetical protein [Agrobacterium rubi]|uniref:hypothetical protein n=1 Tax=Agrobacterium rubi TaxID=28099 RepID=UPI0015737867|nr:hypothetical protein [Agrobacterium rubi]